MPRTKYVSKFTTGFRADDGKTYDLLWGDPVRIDASGKVRARGREGAEEPENLVGASELLELYVIDVGQGDGVLMKTPDDKWHLIDAGTRNSKQQLKKGAPNFLRWKFVEDLGQDRIRLENVILTHPDLDHFGGMIDLFSKKLIGFGHLDAREFELEVENFYHSGMGRFAGADPLGKVEPGEVAPFPLGNHGIHNEGSFITELLDDKASFANPARPLADDYAELARGVGTVPKHVQRIDASLGYLPGYGPADGAGCTIRILGPILETTLTGKKGLRKLGSDSVTRNGHSVVLRVDYGNARILLTGDLNTKSQRLILSYVSENEFAVDVVKGCHHGADDVDLGFVKAMAARATVVSSGDNENYSHPRPAVLGASARYGREGVDEKGKLVPPLIYSTELARSVSLTVAPSKTFLLDDTDPSTPTRIPLANLKWNPPGPVKERSLDVTPLATDLVYGLVNVRTDGSSILCATLEESGHDFDVRVIQAGISPSG